MRNFLISIMSTTMIIPAAAAAAPVSVTVNGPDGRPLVDAVVTLDVPGTPPPVPRGSYAMAQRNVAFAPHVLIVPVGATVSFPNQDRVRHHVYSFSSAKKFDLKLYGRDETKSVSFAKPGIVALGCNIHDMMSGFVFVTATPFAAVSDREGRVTIDGVPPGQVTLSIWHPSIRASGNSLSQAKSVAATGLSTVVSISR
ncbi:MAG: methylamine utilization protein [Sphingomonas bacterium]|nr:methylamine utilization protein [Sphingomonas bacterium]